MKRLKIPSLDDKSSEPARRRKSVFHGEDLWEREEKFKVGSAIGMGFGPIENYKEFSFREFGSLNYNFALLTSMEPKVSFIGVCEKTFENSIQSATVRAEEILRKLSVKKMEHKEAYDNAVEKNIKIQAIGEDNVSGSSSGVALCAAIISAALNIKIKEGNKTAFRGEININGEVTSVGGISEKIAEAVKKKLIRVFIQKGNEDNVDDSVKKRNNHHVYRRFRK